MQQQTIVLFFSDSTYFRHETFRRAHKRKSQLAPQNQDETSSARKSQLAPQKSRRDFIGTGKTTSQKKACPKERSGIGKTTSQREAFANER